MFFNPLTGTLQRFSCFMKRLERLAERRCVLSVTTLAIQLASHEIRTPSVTCSLPIPRLDGPVWCVWTDFCVCAVVGDPS